jgi:hypothetical protein
VHKDHALVPEAHRLQQLVVAHVCHLHPLLWDGTAWHVRRRKGKTT